MSIFKFKKKQLVQLQILQKNLRSFSPLSMIVETNSIQKKLYEIIRKQYTSSLCSLKVFVRGLRRAGLGKGAACNTKILNKVKVINISSANSVTR